MYKILAIIGYINIALGFEHTKERIKFNVGNLKYMQYLILLERISLYLIFIF